MYFHFKYINWDIVFFYRYCFKEGKGIFMNEKQRLESQQINNTANDASKQEKDYSQYFQSVYTPPSLKEAKNAGKKK